MTKLTMVKLTNEVETELGNTFKLRVDKQVVYISFRQSARFVVADVQVGNNYKTFSYYDNKPLLPQVNKSQWVNNVLMSQIIERLVCKLEASPSILC